jgi:hypothetical protein
MMKFIVRERGIVESGRGRGRGGRGVKGEVFKIVFIGEGGGRG